METTQSPKKTSSILLVEDDAVAAEMIGGVISLKYPGAVINLANNGTEGLKLFKEHLPDLVITDINMHEMDGIEMARAIKLIKDDTQFIVFTGSSDRNHMEIFNGIGVIDYIVKPIDFGRLLAAIEQSIN